MITPPVNPNPSSESQLSAAEFGVSESVLDQLLHSAKKGAPYAEKKGLPGFVCDMQLLSSVPTKTAGLSRAIFKSFGVSGEDYQERDLRVDDISDALSGVFETRLVPDSERGGFRSEYVTQAIPDSSCEGGIRHKYVVRRDESLINATVIFLDNVNFAKPSNISTIERFLDRTINGEKFPNLKAVWLGMDMRSDEVAEGTRINLPQTLCTRIPCSYDLDKSEI